MSTFSLPGRWLILPVLAALAAPAIGMVLTAPDPFSRVENRMMAARPSLPADLEGWRTFPSSLDRYLQDNFAFRERLIRANRRWRNNLGLKIQTRQVVAGQEDWLLLQDSLSSTMGIAVRPSMIDAYADVACDLKERLDARGARLLFSIAPNTATIYPEALPGWMPRPPPRTLYDVVLEKVEACGIATLDLRPALLAAKPQGKIYFHHDTHWTLRGALAAYNAIVAAL